MQVLDNLYIFTLISFSSLFSLISALFSCVGHYIPQLAIALLDHNERSNGFKFNLKGVAVRNFHDCNNNIKST